MTTSSLEYQISTDQFVRLQNNPGKCFVPPSRYSWAALGALPPCLLPSSPCPALPCPAATWHIALWAACDGVISPLSMNPTGSGSPWLFPVFPRLPALRYHSADKGSLWLPPGSQLCATWLPALCKEPPAFSPVPPGHLPAPCPAPAGTAPWEDGWVMLKVAKNELFFLLALPSLYNWQCTEIQA